MAKVATIDFVQSTFALFLVVGSEEKVRGGNDVGRAQVQVERLRELDSPYDLYQRLRRVFP